MYAKVRRLFFREHLSISEIGRRTRLSRNTIKKWLKAPDGTGPTYQRAQATGKLTPFEARLKLWLEADARRPKRDRRTA
jgi:transposase